MIQVENLNNCSISVIFMKQVIVLDILDRVKVAA